MPCPKPNPAETNVITMLSKVFKTEIHWHVPLVRCQIVILTASIFDFRIKHRCSPSEHQAPSDAVRTGTGLERRVTKTTARLFHANDLRDGWRTAVYRLKNRHEASSGKCDSPPHCHHPPMRRGKRWGLASSTDSSPQEGQNPSLTVVKAWTCMSL